MADVLKKTCKSRDLYFIHVTADVTFSAFGAKAG